MNQEKYIYVKRIHKKEKSHPISSTDCTKLHKPFLWIFLVILLFSNTFYAQNDFKVRLDELISENFETNAPGCSVVVVKNGKAIYSNATGIGNMELNIPITKSSVFLLGSVAKQFTGYGIATLIEDGTIHPSDDIRTYLPDLPNYGQKITVEDLIHHKSGLIEQYTLLIYEGYRLQDATSKDDVMRVLSVQKELDFEPGTNYTYSNSNYRLLAELVETVTKMPFEAYMQKIVFDKLGMTHSSFIDNPSTLIPNKVAPYQPNGNGTYSNNVYNGSTTGSTGLWSNSEDLEKWLTHLSNIKAQYPKLYNRMKTTTSLKDGTIVGYGYGLEVGELFGKKLLYHNGVDAGYNSQVYFFPQPDLGIAVVSNNNGYSFDFANQIAAVFLDKGNEAETGSVVKNKTAITSPSIQLSNSQLNTILGKYELGDGSILVVKVEDKKLFRSIEGRPDEELMAMSANNVFYKNRPEVALKFSNPDGKSQVSEGFHLVFNGNEVEYCKRIVEQDIETLKSLVGIYQHPSLNITLTAQLEAGKLTLSHYKHGKMILNPTSKALEFSGTDWWINRLSFRRNDTGELSLHLLNSPSGERFNGIKLIKTK